jgi:hypothetical protein
MHAPASEGVRYKSNCLTPEGVSYSQKRSPQRLKPGWFRATYGLAERHALPKKGRLHRDSTGARSRMIRIATEVCLAQKSRVNCSAK